NQLVSLLHQQPDLLFVLSPYGRVMYCSPSVTTHLGFTRQQFVGKFVVDIVVADDCEYFTKELNGAAESGMTGRSLGEVRLFLRFKKRDGTELLMEVVGRAQFNTSESANDQSDDSRTANVTDSSYCHSPVPMHSECKCFFLTARPYQLQSNYMIDSFLEYKIDNIRMKHLIGNIKAGAPPSRLPSFNPESGMAASTNHNYTMADYEGISNENLIRRHSSEEYAASVNGDLSGGMLVSPKSLSKSGDGQISNSDGNLSYTVSSSYFVPVLNQKDIKGNKSISRVNAPLEVKALKKPRLSDDKEYVCTECGTLDSPEWRKGPQGPKTLCNACGLRWSKSLKKK
ncbi:hypothetical protein V1511DRAFT_450567, partial [Dipodascopsis uninucleata]